MLEYRQAGFPLTKECIPGDVTWYPGKSIFDAGKFSEFLKSEISCASKFWWGTQMSDNDSWTIVAKINLWGGSFHFAWRENRWWLLVFCFAWTDSLELPAMLCRNHLRLKTKVFVLDGRGVFFFFLRCSSFASDWLDFWVTKRLDVAKPPPHLFLMKNGSFSFLCRLVRKVVVCSGNGIERHDPIEAMVRQLKKI